MINQIQKAIDEALQKKNIYSINQNKEFFKYFKY